MVEGTLTGTSTILDGKYTITAPSKGKITVSVIGFTTVTVSIDGRSTIDFSLKRTGMSLKTLLSLVTVPPRRSDFSCWFGLYRKV